MKKFWIVLISLSLITAFTMPVLAVDVKFNGEFKVQGIYEDNKNLGQPAGGQNQGVSLTWQRLRVGTIFEVAEGLSLTTRFDALERVWGAPRSVYPTAQPVNTLGTSNSGPWRDAESQNIAFEQAFATFNAVYGVFKVGYQTQGRFGTAFGDNGERDNGPRVKYEFVSGPWNFAGVWDKIDGARNNPAYAPAGAMDIDIEKYQMYGIYKWSKGEGGLLLVYQNNTSKSDPVLGTDYRAQTYTANPFFKGTFGPVYVEAEAAYVWGKQQIVVPLTGKYDQDRAGYYGYIMGKVDLAPFYVGAAVFYVSGDDGQDTSKNKSGPGTGTDFNPCLMMLNYDLYRLGGFAGNTASPYGFNTSDGSGMNNVYAYHIFAGVKPIPKMDIKVSWTLAGFNETSTAANGTTNPKPGQSKDIGNEFDLTATYKIYDNLTYMVGAAYFMTGDFFKGAPGVNATTKSDYLLTHMLTLSF